MSIFLLNVSFFAPTENFFWLRLLPKMFVISSAYDNNAGRARGNRAKYASWSEGFDTERVPTDGVFV